MPPPKQGQSPRERAQGSSARTGRCAGLLVALFLLLACSANDPDDALALYLQRLSGALSVEVAPVEVMPIEKMPPARMLRLDIAGSDIDMLDFLALTGCELQVTIGKRNSSLGRLARHSQRLLLELEYLQLAPACIRYQRERGELALATTLEAARVQKRAQLPALIFNATLGSEEYRQFWKAPARMEDYPANVSSAVVTSLLAVNALARHWLTGDYTADNLQFELLLADISAGDGGQLRKALAAQAGALQAANRMLEQRMARGQLCTPPLRPAAADVLDNVMRKFFIAGTQPRAAALNRRFHELLPPVTALEQLLANAVPPAYRSWQQQRDDSLKQWVQAPREHVSRLQLIQQPCQQGEQLAR